MRRWADVDFEWLAARLEFIGERDVVSEETVARHLDAHHARQDGSRVEPNPHLRK